MAKRKSKKTADVVVATPKAAASETPKKRSRDEPSEVLAEIGIDVDKASPMKRALKKTTSSADRALKEKFWFVDPDVIDAMEGDCVGPVQDVLEAFKKQSDQTYLPAQFWISLDAKWQFPKKHAFNAIPEPTVAEKVRPALNEAIGQTRDQNPGARRVNKFEKFFMYSGPINYTELYGSLMGCQPEVNTSPTMVHAMEAIVLKKIAEDRLDAEYPELWEAIEDHMAGVAVRMWKNDASIGRSLWVEQNVTLVDMFVPGEHRAKVEEALADKKDPELINIREVLSSSLGAELYAEQGLRYSWLLYVANINKGMKSLIDHSFDDLEVANFRTLMGQEVEKLKEAGAASFDTKNMKVDFCDKKDMVIEITDPNDQWYNTLEAAKKTIIISNKLAPRLPWEDLYIGDENKIEGIPETLTLPPKEVAAMVSFRKSVLKILSQECRSNTLDEWKRVVKKHKATFKRHCQSWGLEDVWLMSHVEAMLIAKVEGEALDTFPKEEPTANRDVEATIANLEKLKCSRVVLCVGQKLLKALNAVIGFLKKLQEGTVAFTAADHEGMSSFQKRAVAKSAAFVYCEIKEKQPARSKWHGRRFAYGQLALEYSFKQVEATEAGDALRSLRSVYMRDLQVFKWMLPLKQQSIIKAWIKAATAKHRSVMLGGAIEDMQVEKDGLLVGEGKPTHMKTVEDPNSLLAKMPSLFMKKSGASGVGARPKLGAKAKTIAIDEKKKKQVESGVSKLFGSKASVDLD